MNNLPQQNHLRRLDNQLRSIEALWEKLVHVKWSQDSFALLTRLSKNMEQIAQESGNHAIAKLTKDLDSHLQTCIDSGRMPQGPEQDRLLALIATLHRQLSYNDENKPEHFKTEREAAVADQGGEVLLADAGEVAPQLFATLEEAGFRVRRYSRSPEFKTRLALKPPAAIIIDVDFPHEPLAGAKLIAELRAGSAPMPPVFFVAEHGDLNTRLEAVRAGGAAYFTRPLDTLLLLKKLNELVFHEASRDYRVLIVNGNRADAAPIAGLLGARGIVTQVLDQPTQIMQALHRFAPDLLMLEIDLSEIGSPELIQVIRQHTTYEELPILLLFSENEQSRQPAALSAGGDGLLSKWAPEEYMLSVVTQWLRRSRNLHQKLSTLSRLDPVSGLPNREIFLGRLRRTTAGLGVASRSVAVMLIMLNNLRAIRASTDIATADKLVQQAARHLQKALGHGYEPTRLTELLFAVLITDMGKDALAKTARTVHEEMELKTYEVGDKSIALQVSIGISVSSDPNGDPLTLIRDADFACSQARDNAKERIHIHRPRFDEQAKGRYEERLFAEIRDAVKQERMSLVFQPIVSLRADKSERYEIFLRMRNSQGEELLPETVFGIVQKYRLGLVLDRWVIEQSIRILSQRQAQGRATTLFVNISPAILQDNGLMTWLWERLSSSDIQPGNLVFEISETAAADNSSDSHKPLDIFKSVGCGLSLDHFGVRPDSMHLLRLLSPSYVKLDPVFLNGLSASKERQEELRSLVVKLHTQGSTVIMSGIEDLSVLSVLWTCGVGLAQGFVLQPPREQMSYDFSAEKTRFLHS